MQDVAYDVGSVICSISDGVGFGLSSCVQYFGTTSLGYVAMTLAGTAVSLFLVSLFHVNSVRR